MSEFSEDRPQKVTKDLLSTLKTKFGYDTATRNQFIGEFQQLIKSIDGTWLLYNQMRKNDDYHEPPETEALRRSTTFCSPSLQRNPLAASASPPSHSLFSGDSDSQDNDDPLRQSYDHRTEDSATPFTPLASRNAREAPSLSRNARESTPMPNTARAMHSAARRANPSYGSASFRTEPTRPPDANYSRPRPNTPQTDTDRHVLLLEQALIQEAKNRRAQAAQIEALRAKLEEKPALSFGDDGAEPWVADSHIERHFAKPYRWWAVKEGRWENPYESRIRATVYNHVMSLTTKEIHANIEHGDIRAIYARCLNLGKEGADRQAFDLRKKLFACRKRQANGSSRKVLPWITEMYTILDQLSALKAPADTTSLRFHIIDCLEEDDRQRKGDKIYATFIQDVRAHKKWTMDYIRIKMEAVAQRHDDLCGDTMSAAAPTAPLTGKAHANRSQAGFPTPAAPAATADTRRPRQKTPEEIASLKGEICRRFLLGVCRFGDSCYRSHEYTLEDLAKKKQEQKKEGRKKPVRQPATAETSPPAPAAPPAQPRPKVEPRLDKEGNQLPCYNWEMSGKCLYENMDDCPFAHVEASRGPT